MTLRRRRLLVVGTLLLLAVLALSACGPAAPAPAATAPSGEARTQTSDGGQVTVKVTWTGPAAGPVFDVVLDTHAVDVDVYDLAKLAVLRTGDGREVAPSRWDAPRGGHHRQGALAFPSAGPDGQALLGPTTGSIELVVRDVAGVPERAFRWAL